MHRTALTAQKGGVGKTTWTLLLASEMARRGCRVLVADLDPQANATSTLAPQLDPEVSRTVYDAWHDGGAGAALAAITSSRWESVDLLPGDRQMAEKDAERPRGSEQRLRRVLDGLGDVGYDIVLFDTPRSLGPVLDAVLVETDDALLVLEATKDGLTGATMAEEAITQIRDLYRPDLKVAGYIVNRYTGLEEQAARLRALIASVGEMIVAEPLPEWVAVSRVGELGWPLWDQTRDPRARRASELVARAADRLWPAHAAAPAVPTILEAVAHG